MKRLFGLLFVFVVFFSFFSNPTSLFAAVSRAEFDTVVDSLYNNEVKFVIDTKGPIGIIPTNSLKSRLYARSDFLFNTFGNKTTTTVASLKSLVAADWKYQVEGIRYGNEAIFVGTNSIMDNIIISLNGAATQAGISQQVQAGRLSQEQASQARAAAVAQSNQERAALNAKEAAECGLTSAAKIVACVDSIVQWLVKNTLMQFAGFFVWLTSNMFNYVIGVGVLNFKNWAPDALYPIWKLIRQAVSLIIVFVGLYLGFLYIIGTESSKSKFGKFVPWLIIFALFVNFSYPITRFAVDMSNVITLTIYTAAVGNAALNGSSGSTAGAIILNRLGLQDLALGATYTEGGNAGANIISNINSVPAALLAVIFIFYAAYIFFMATALIAMRTIALVFLIVGSPLLLIDSVIPVLGGKAQEARKIFFEQLAVGPVFMILLALTMKFLLVFSKGPLKANISQTGGDPVGVFFNILMMTIMLHLTLKITKDVSGKLGEFATEKMGKVGGFAVGAATGGAGLLARGSIGKLAMKARDSKWVTNNQDSFLGRRMYDMSNSLSKSSFDLRNSSVIAGGMQKAGLGMGKGRTAGYEEAMEARKKDILARGARIKTRYERDITDPKTGQIVHRKGDVDMEAELALDRYTARGGGSLFMAKDELNGYGNRKGVRELLGEQADAESKKRIDEAKSKSEQDIQTYSSIKKDPLNRDGMGRTEEERKDKFRVMLRHELDDLKKVDPGLQGQQAQSLIQTLQKIDDKRSAELVEKYNKTNDLAEKQRVMYDIKSELAAIQTRDGDLESHEARALLGTLQSIEDINKKAQQALEEQAQKFVNRYNKIEGNEDEVRTARLRMVNNLEDENLRREVEKLGIPMEKKTGSTSRLVNQDGVAFSDTDINRSTAPDLDLTYNEWSSRDTPPSMRGTATPYRDPTDIDAERARKQRDTFARAQAELDRDSKQSDTPAGVPETHDPRTDDVAAMAMAEAARIIDDAKKPPTAGGGTPVTAPKPISPTPSSASSAVPTQATVKNLENELNELREAMSGDYSQRLDVIEGFMRATKGTGTVQDTDEYDRTRIEAKKMGFGQSTIEQLYRDAAGGTYTEKSIAGARKNTAAMKTRMGEIEKKLKEAKEAEETT